MEDAVEAEAEALFLGHDPLGDLLEMCRLVWTVKDVDRAQEAFLSTPRMRSVPFNPAQVVRTKKVVENVWRAIKSKCFYPAPSPMSCPSCPYRTQCREWSG